MMFAGSQPSSSVHDDRAFQLEVLRLQMMQARKVALYGAYFTVGAAFEVFSLTLVLTGVLLEKEIPVLWWVLIAVYLFTGVGFIAYALVGFGRTRRLEESELQRIGQRYT